MDNQMYGTQREEMNALGLAGLIFSILGWLTCGLLCIPGAFLSFLGLFSRAPKTLAIVGLIVGFPGAIFFFVVGLGIIMAVLGLGAAGVAAAGVAMEEADRLAAEAQVTIVENDEMLSGDYGGEGAFVQAEVDWSAEQGVVLPRAAHGAVSAEDDAVLLFVKATADGGVKVEKADGTPFPDDREQQNAQIVEYVQMRLAEGAKFILLKAEPTVRQGEISRLTGAISDSLEEGEVINISVLDLEESRGDK